MMTQIAPSSRPGMGSIPYSGGAAFRVWAPHAERVAVAGTFNDWSADAMPLAGEGNGYWSADVDGAKPGDEYKYVLTSGDRTIYRLDPYAREISKATGNSVVYAADFDWGAESFAMPPWNELVIYELHIGTFNDQPGDQPGNLNGAIAKLPYLRDLGVNAVEIMPPMEFAGGFSWGYNPANLFAIERDYGGPSGFKAFVAAAHAQGIAVIFDVVYNHFGPSDLDLWQFDGWSENGKGGVYFYNDDRSRTDWGDTRPDYGRGEVRQFIRDNAMLWLNRFRVDGLRWDATAFIRNMRGNNNDPANDIPDGWSLMQWINDEIDTRQPWKLTIAEDLRNNAWITHSTREGGAGFDAQWDANFVHPIRQAIIVSNDTLRDMGAVRDAILYRYGPDACARVIYTESHDEDANGHERVPEEIWPGNAGSWFSKKRSTLGAALVFTSPGIPMIFQGQEFLEDEWFRDVDPIDWSKLERYGGIRLLYRDLIRLRRNWYDSTRGLRGQGAQVYHVNDADKLLAFHRWDQGGPRDDVVVVVNMANRGYDSYSIGFPRAGTRRVRFNSDWAGYDGAFGDHNSYDAVAAPGERDGMPCSGNIGIGPYSAIILSQDG
ncbi:MAG: alpha-amylase family glycosyl hydrolase [Roseiflexaceae bacterium]